MKKAVSNATPAVFPSADKLVYYKKRLAMFGLPAWPFFLTACLMTAGIV
jgi:hypothetical protein